MTPKDSQDIITDKKTGLQWKISGESGTTGGSTWSEAQSWVQSLSVGGGGWRMPTISELAGLSAEHSVGCHLELIIRQSLNCPWVWSGEIRDSSSARTFHFTTGWESLTDRDFRHPLVRVLAVRSR